MRSNPILLVALISFCLGHFCLFASVLNFFIRSKITKLGPSLIQGLTEVSSLLWVHIFAFLLAISVLYAVAGGLLAWAVQPVCQRCMRGLKTARQAVLLLFLLAAIWVTLLSAHAYKHTLTGCYLNDFASSSTGTLLILALGATIIIAAAAGLAIRSFKLIRAGSRRPAVLPALIVSIGLTLSVVGWFGLPDATSFPNTDKRPHLIIIGIDGWRHDAMPSEARPEVRMPFVSKFLDGAASIEEAWTPVARTFPAWWTIFTGQFPPSNGVRFNLVPNASISSEPELPKILGQLGYHRILAMDERRFANIGKEHHFDTVVGPAMGAADFLIGNINDTPLSNLVVNTRLGGLLLPFSHANRAAYSTYRPKTFSRQLTRTLQSAPAKPLFLAAHFELPHWPYKWATSPEADRNADAPFFAEYLETLNAVDTQIEALFQTLSETSVLENARVVLMSDHGEAFANKNTVWTNTNGDDVIKTPPGHGNSVLGLYQHRIPLAFRSYGRHKLVSGVRRGSASLADIYPTLMEWLDVPVGKDVDGVSLVSFLRDPALRIPDRPIPLETGFNTDSSSEGILAPGRLFAEGAAYYNVTSRGRLEIKQSVLSKIIGEKQTAVVHAGQILASRDGPCNPGLLLNIRTRSYKKISEQEIPGDIADHYRRFFCDD